jgi:hypothetical protein
MLLRVCVSTSSPAGAAATAFFFDDATAAGFALTLTLARLATTVFFTAPFTGFSSFSSLGSSGEDSLTYREGCNMYNESFCIMMNDLKIKT